ncbi:hypothetical protein OIU76_019780 [Salix suchowensis]|uniref:PROTEIN THI031 putative-RELATED n=2 Tax=Salix TaxID=40685 RepID=A0A9Q0X145_9ROSI|nr:hypothetical protein OIU76_019780 [Salix suchowensis]KAJ6302127.1 hypothetical protein OIU77_016258 [Salix suchowensis]KAJ6776854.1 PROTEIN THI031 putative-RELATED [Salix koriyanagi]
MKREGRQHGMVRTYKNSPSPWSSKLSDKKFNRFDTPPAAAGLLTKVPSKPTNHSKFTGKCAKPRCTGCHVLPSCKSKNKTKESHKVKSHDRAAFEFAGFSATAILDHLATHDDEVFW